MVFSLFLLSICMFLSHRSVEQSAVSTLMNIRGTHSTAVKGGMFGRTQRGQERSGEGEGCVGALGSTAPSWPSSRGAGFPLSPLPAQKGNHFLVLSKAAEQKGCRGTMSDE